MSKQYNKKNSKKFDRKKEYAKERNSEPRSTSTNHLEWYVPDANLLKDVASIPFNYRTGDKLPYGPGSEYRSVPGAVRVNYLPAFGRVQDPNDPINVASTAVYSWVRHANSGSRNYDHPDLFLYLLAMDSIYAGITWCQRLIYTVQMYLRENKYTPKELLTFMGVQFNADLVGALPSMRSRLNQIILKAQTLAVPANLSLYARHSYMNLNYYTDEPNSWSQIYFFSPDRLYKFQLDSDGKGELTDVVWTENVVAEAAKPWTHYFDVLDTMVDAVYSDEDAGIMSGDILKAYGEGNIMRLATVPADGVISPIYDVEMLHQIHNCDQAGVVVANTAQIKQVVQDTGSGLAGYLVSNPKFYSTVYDVVGHNQTYEWSKLFDLHIDITPENVMRSSRLKFASFTTTEEGTASIEGVGSEIVTAVIYLNFGTDGVASDYYSTLEWNMDPQGIDLSIVGETSNISYYPIYYANVSGETPTATTTPMAFGNTDRVTVLTADQIRQLNQVAILGLFDVPRLTFGR